MNFLRQFQLWIEAKNKFMRQVFILTFPRQSALVVTWYNFERLPQINFHYEKWYFEHSIATDWRTSKASRATWLKLTDSWPKNHRESFRIVPTCQVLLGTKLWFWALVCIINKKPVCPDQDFDFLQDHIALCISFVDLLESNTVFFLIIWQKWSRVIKYSLKGPKGKSLHDSLAPIRIF